MRNFLWSFWVTQLILNEHVRNEPFFSVSQYFSFFIVTPSFSPEQLIFDEKKSWWKISQIKINFYFAFIHKQSIEFSRGFSDENGKETRKSADWRVCKKVLNSNRRRSSNSIATRVNMFTFATFYFLFVCLHFLAGMTSSIDINNVWKKKTLKWKSLASKTHTVRCL